MKKNKLARARTAMHAARHGENQARDNYRRIKTANSELREEIDQLRRHITFLERELAVVKKANRRLGDRLIAGRPLIDVVAKRPVAVASRAAQGGAA